MQPYLAQEIITQLKRIADSLDSLAKGNEKSRAANEFASKLIDEVLMGKGDDAVIMKNKNLYPNPED